MRQKIDRGETPIETNLGRAYRSGQSLPEHFREALLRLQIVLEERVGDGDAGGHTRVDSTH